MLSVISKSLCLEISEQLQDWSLGWISGDSVDPRFYFQPGLKECLGQKKTLQILLLFLFFRALCSVQMLFFCSFIKSFMLHKDPSILEMGTLPFLSLYLLWPITVTPNVEILLLSLNCV